MNFENEFKSEDLELNEELNIPINQPKDDGAKPDLINLQMLMVSSSMNHEYVRKEYEATKSFSKKQELMNKMTSLKNLYFTARKKMADSSPERLVVLENELKIQKTQALADITLH
ncbi:MAG: hypothetical protein IPJ69_01450 [Deltaproteobacteria bacterium]|nr:MAG: hypothetical protein IPJ69_01450 [Deltaproteobacteria bacterium]